MYVIKDLFEIQVVTNVNVKLCDFGEYLDYENGKCRKKIVDKLLEECTEAKNEVKLVKITLAENENKHKRNSCTLHIVLFSIVFTINWELVLVLFTTNT